MRLGLLADIHERSDLLVHCIEALRTQTVDSFVVLGDVLNDAQRIDETVDLLAALPSRGVWGNHDFGLCGQPSPEVRTRFGKKVIDYFETLQPWLEIDGCRFQHIDPHLDPTDLLDLWMIPEPELQRAQSFSQTPHRRVVIGHVHRWSLITPAGVAPWSGRDSVRLDRGERYLITVGAVEDGYCAVFDTELDEIVPISVRG